MKGRNNGFASAGSSVSFGDFGLKATSHGMLTSRQIEAARRALVRHIKSCLLYTSDAADE